MSVRLIGRSRAPLHPSLACISSRKLATRSDIDKKRDWFLQLIDLLKVRARTIDDVVRQAAPFLRDDIEYDPDAVKKQWGDRAFTGDILAATRETLANAPQWEQAPLEESLRKLAESRGLSAGKLYQPMRVALTGLTVSPGIFEMLGAMGRELSLKRLTAAEEWLIAHKT